jgi:hypothetical protein
MERHLTGLKRLSRLVAAGRAVCAGSPGAVGARTDRSRSAPFRTTRK